MKATIKISKPAAKDWKVKGKDIPEVFKNLNKHKWWGRYRSHEAVDYAKKGTISAVSISGKPEIIMPTWTGYKKATPEEKKSWDDMWKALHKHEKNHHTIFSDAATAFKKALEKKGDLPKADMDKEAASFKKETQKLQDAYDKKSKHGENEGVILMVP